MTSRSLRSVFPLLALLLFTLTACGSSGSVPLEISEAFDVEGNWIADLTEPGDEFFDQEIILGAIGQARSRGTELRVVVVGSADEVPGPAAIVDKYGGTVLVYKANDGSFLASSADMSTDQVSRATQGAAADAPTISDSVIGFVQTLGQEGGAQGSSFFDTFVLWILLPLAALFMLVMLARYLRAKSGARKRIDEFGERKQSLGQWAGQLPEEIQALRGAVALSSDESRTTLQEVEEFSDGIGAKIAAAETMADLDGIEMRLGRVVIKLRDLRKAVLS